MTAGSPSSTPAWTPTAVGAACDDFFASAADAVAELAPQSERRTLADQGHPAAPDALGPVLAAFFR